MQQTFQHFNHPGDVPILCGPCPQTLDLFQHIKPTSYKSQVGLWIFTPILIVICFFVIEDSADTVKKAGGAEDSDWGIKAEGAQNRLCDSSQGSSERLRACPANPVIGCRGVPSTDRSAVRLLFGRMLPIAASHIGVMQLVWSRLRMRN